MMGESTTDIDVSPPDATRGQYLRRALILPFWPVLAGLASYEAMLTLGWQDSEVGVQIVNVVALIGLVLGVWRAIVLIRLAQRGRSDSLVTWVFMPILIAGSTFLWFWILGHLADEYASRFVF